MTSAFAAFLLLSAVPAIAGESTQSVRDFLEGVWLIGRQPDEGGCLAHWYGETEIEFEFRKSGGRAQMFQPYDLFTVIVIPELTIEDQFIAITARSRDGRLVPFMKLRQLAPDRFEISSITWKDGSSDPRIAYRCGEPDRSVNRSVPIEALSVLTPVLSGGQLFPMTSPGVADEELCASTTRPKGWIKFEVIGPVHFWAMGKGFGRERVIDLDHVLSIRQNGPHTLELELQKKAGSRDGWNRPGPDTTTYELTVIDHGNRIEIPELSASFVRCKPHQPESPY